MGFVWDMIGNFVIRWCMTFSAFGTKLSTNLCSPLYGKPLFNHTSTLLINLIYSMRDTSAAKKAVIVTWKSLSQSNQQVAKKEYVDPSTAPKINKCYGQKHNFDEKKPCSNHPHKLSNKAVHCALHLLSTGQRKNASDLQHTDFPHVTVDTICKVLKDTGMKAYTRHNVPLITKSQQRHQVDWAENIVIGWRRIGMWLSSQMSLNSISLGQMVGNGAGGSPRRDWIPDTQRRMLCMVVGTLWFGGASPVTVSVDYTKSTGSWTISNTSTSSPPTSSAPSLTITWILPTSIFNKLVIQSTVPGIPRASSTLKALICSPGLPIPPIWTVSRTVGIMSTVWCTVGTHFPRIWTRYGMLCRMSGIILTRHTSTSYMTVCPIECVICSRQRVSQPITSLLLQNDVWTLTIRLWLMLVSSN